MLIALALIVIAVHLATNGQYGFHRDELATLDDARHLAWGYVAYPPLTPFIARIALILFGPSLVWLRFFSSLAIGIATILTGWMTRELGGRRSAQLVAALAVAIGPVAVISGALFQYVAFDYLWWVVIAWLMIRLLRSEDPRWWLAIGAAAGLGMMTKYTIGVMVLAIGGALVVTPSRRYLKSPWLWAGAALAFLIFLPNLLWQMQHRFISLDFLRSIHVRDVRIGRTQGFLLNQLFVPASFFAIPLWVAGLFYSFKHCRPIAWMFIISFAILLTAKGRDYYMAPAYPMLLAAGAVAWQQWSPIAQKLTVAALTLGCVLSLLLLPIPPINSDVWNKVSSRIYDFREEIGWPELVDTVASIRSSVPDAAVLAGNYGEAGAIDLYGPARGLPPAISGINSYWLRGYGDPPPQTLIVVGLSRAFLEQTFRSCDVAGHVHNRYGVMNEESTEHPDIYVCRGLRKSWPEFWKDFEYFG
jgi:Dolichyl-phosphate-mannose-protein mannosyltransferase